MNEKMFNTRIIHKHDIEANWNKAVNFIPMQGEIIVYDIDETYNYERVKIGDGTTKINDLPFIDIQADWNQSDSTADDYIKNRTHWKEIKTGVLIPETSIEFSNAGQPAENPFILEIQEGSTYEVTWNGNVYQCVAYIAVGSNSPSIGNGTIISVPGGNDEPFFITVFRGMTLVFAEEAGTHTVSISGEATTWHTLDKRYLPTNLATTDDVQSVANDVQSVANDVNKKMNATNPVGTGSFSMNRKAGTAVGQNSHTEGYNTTASGNYSHAEGGSTIASRKYSHAEGYYTNASGENSHAEGFYTNVYGTNSHVEGCGTNASGMNQHVQGKYNKSSSAYVHIVGNGTSDNARSNAHTLDWRGNAWFQGDVYVGGTGQDDEAAERLAKMSDIPSIEGFASESYVDTKLAAIVNSAPEALNTLDELAAALGDDSNFATTVTNQIASKQDSITGTEGQFVVIGADGKPTVKTIPSAEGVNF